MKIARKIMHINLIFDSIKKQILSKEIKAKAIKQR
jgi:hypothetical protein